MCEQCKLHEYAAELSTEKWLQAQREAQIVATERDEARLRLARARAVLAEAEFGTGVVRESVLREIRVIVGE